MGLKTQEISQGETSTTLKIPSLSFDEVKAKLDSGGVVYFVRFGYHPSPIIFVATEKRHPNGKYAVWWDGASHGIHVEVDSLMAWMHNHRYYDNYWKAWAHCQKNKQALDSYVKA